MERADYLLDGSLLRRRGNAVFCCARHRPFTVVRTASPIASTLFSLDCYRCRDRNGGCGCRRRHEEGRIAQDVCVVFTACQQSSRAVHQPQGPAKSYLPHPDRAQLTATLPIDPTRATEWRCTAPSPCTCDDDTVPLILGPSTLWRQMAALKNKLSTPN